MVNGMRIARRTSTFSNGNGKLTLGGRLKEVEIGCELGGAFGAIGETRLLVTISESEWTQGCERLW